MWLLGFSPESKVNRRGHDIFVINSDIGPFPAFFVYGADWASDRRGHSGNHDCPAFSMIGVEFDAGLWLAEFVGGLMHHVYLLFATNAREMPVIANANEQSTSIGIGKC